MSWNRCSSCAFTKMTWPRGYNAILLGLIRAAYLHARDTAHDIVDLVLVVRHLRIFFSCSQHIHATAHRRYAQKLYVGTLARDLVADLGDRIKRFHALSLPRRENGG